MVCRKEIWRRVARLASELRLSGRLRVGVGIGDAPDMDHRRRPSSPQVPPGDEPAGWVVAGEERDGWVPPSPRNAWADPAPPRDDRPPPPPGWYATPYDPGYGGQWYGEPAAPDHPPPAPGYPPESSYLPPEPAYPPPPEPSYLPPERPPAAYQQSAYPASGYPPGPAQPGPAGRRPGRQPPPPDPDEPPPPAWTSALLWTIGAFLIPALAYLGWALTLGGAAPADCLDAAGTACPAPRAAAVDRLTSALPALGAALALALLVAVGLRRMAADWRGMTVGLAAAVIGAGLATLVATALS